MIIPEELSEVCPRPHQFIASCDEEIVRLLAEVRDRLAAGGSHVEQGLGVALAWMNAQAKVLKGEVARHEGIIEALAAGGLARSNGLPITANPHVPGEFDCCWIYWNTGWAAG